MAFLEGYLNRQAGRQTDRQIIESQNQFTSKYITINSYNPFSAFATGKEYGFCPMGRAVCFRVKIRSLMDEAGKDSSEANVFKLF